MLLAEDARPEMTPRQAAARLGVTPEALQKLRERGNGPAFFKVGRSVRYDPADIAAYLGRRRCVPANEVRT